MKIERINVAEWPWMRDWLRARLDEIGSGMTAEDVPKFRALLENPRHWVVRAEKEGVVGLFIFMETGRREYEVHASGSKTGWGWIGLSRRVLKWFAEKARPVSVRTFVAEGNARSELFVRACGLKAVGVERKWLRGWKWVSNFAVRMTV